MRRLVALSCAVVLFNTIFLAALTPLLPGLAAQFGLSKTQAGLLVASYAAGVLMAALPAGVVVSRLGARATVLAGLVLMSGSSVLFAVAPNIWILDAARFGQGAASAIGWTGALAWVIGAVPVERRGEVIGVSMSATVLGALLGPVLGAAAGAVGIEPAFTAVALIGVALMVWSWLTPPPARTEHQPLRALAYAFFREPLLRLGFWLGAMTAGVFGAVSLLAPLRLGELGWSSIGIGATFFAAAALQTLWSPFVGRWSDRSGRLVPVRVALVSAAVVLAAMASAPGRWIVAALVVAVALSASVFWVSGVAIVTDGTDAAAIQHGLGFALMNLAWAPGHFAGAGVGGALAGATSDAVPFLALSAVCVATLLVLRRRQMERPTSVDLQAREAA